MTDQTIPADDVREIIGKMRYHANHDNVRGTEEEYVRFFASQLEDLLPTPARPTLADMTMEERHACRWMQADVDGLSRRWLILNPYDEDLDVEVVSESGLKEYLTPSRVTPRPDLPRMEWPGNKKPTPALPDGWRLAEHQKYGRVVVTRPDPDDEGEVAIIRTLTTRPSRAVLTWCDPNELTYLDQEADQDGEEATKVDYVSVEGGGTEFGPWTFARLPKKADQ